MSDKRETSFDGYVSAADGGRGMFCYRRPRKPKPKPRVCDRCKFLYGDNWEHCDHKDLVFRYS